LKVTVLGAGIGGLSTAIALKHKGFDVDVYERHSSRTDIGAGIVCWPNASFVLNELDMLDDIASISGRPITMQRRSNQGEDLGSLDIVKLNERMGYPSFSIFRKDLMKILGLHTSQLGIDVKYNHTVTKLSSTQAGLSQIHLNNGTIVQTDLIIGADGRMNSIARAYVNGDNQPVYQKFINWIGVYQSEQAIFEEIVIGDYWGVGERFGIVPISSNKAYWAGAVAASEINDREPANYKRDLLSLFQHWPEPISTIINETPLTDINKIYVHDHNPMDTWHKNNVLVIGDAAHAPLPTSGQGACQALEDAWHLAKLLEKDCTNLAMIFQEFTKIRLAKTTGITLGARQFASSLFNTDSTFCMQRNLSSKAIDYNAVIEGMSKGWASGLPINV